MLIFIYGMARLGAVRHHDPANYGNVGLAMLTMFVMLTLENFPDNVAMGQEISQWTIVFFISYVLLASFLIFNLFIGIVLNSMEEARAADRKEHENDDLLEPGCAPRERRWSRPNRNYRRPHRDDR